MSPNSLWFYFLENVVYKRKDPVPRTRTVPMEVLAVGLPRSGTESLKDALEILGYPTYHGYDYVTDLPGVPLWNRLVRRKYYPSSGPWFRSPRASEQPLISATEFDQILGHCKAVTDSAAAAFAVELTQAYPNAKIILNRRTDLDAWKMSVMKNLVALGQLPLLKVCLWFNGELFWLHHFLFDLMYPALFASEYGTFADAVQGKAKRVNQEHAAMVRGAVPKERLLEWTVEDGWEPLCAFLGKEVPKEPFPSSNAGVDFTKRTNDIIKARLGVALRNLLLWTALFAGLGATAWHRR
ncbi:uncharacterized protein HMPREF1541_02486 [Cyphellophora europaea CBS 101466]|uniref:NAD dependent epimerase/dehydratase n=1 Tax=Cyphellophora europaea (strain CBS 101466) TaxID=1220924 RepID=W2S3S2_CYPE1|nr:uncharacterized protein HMPREF1541_02486 [Cyphellophora europaea CBS 101466]ETN43327.1 hypothetical protein HMPREF1541_02486 [Cyphellophora europaea CBS 101466]